MPVTESQQPTAAVPEPTTVLYADWVLSCDVEATREVLRSFGPSAPEVCRCLSCRSFFAAADEIAATAKVRAEQGFYAVCLTPTRLAVTDISRVE